jgi:hypothetical protein
VTVQEVRWDKGGTVRAWNLIFFSLEKERKIINWEHGIVPAVKTVQLAGGRCHINSERSVV